MFSGIQEKRTAKSILLIKTFLGLVEMMFGLVNASFNLPKWQAVEMTFFAPCINGENEAFLLMSPLRNVVPQDVLTAINRPPNFE